MSLSVLHVVASIDAEHGGPSRSVTRLCDSLVDQGCDVALVTTATQGKSWIEPESAVTTYVAEPLNSVERALRSPWSFYQTLRRALDREQPEVLHDHGAWLPSNALAALFATKKDIPFVLSVRGMMTSWALEHKQWKKRLAWTLYQRQSMESASLFHVTSSDEADTLVELGLHQPMAVLPNGVTVPPSSIGMDEQRGGKSMKALFLGRIHPVKGLSRLLKAWDHIRPEGWELDIVGPDAKGHRDELRRQAAAANLEGNVQFLGPVGEDEKWKTYAQADLFVLPSHSENFGIVIAEALASGVPVLTTKGTPWADLEKRNCGWWVESTLGGLESALEEATSLSESERREMGRRGRKLVEQKYSWTQVGRQMKRVYRWLLEEGERPNCICEPAKHER